MSFSSLKYAINVAALIGVSTFFSASSYAADIKVMSSGGMYSSMEELVPIFEKKTGHKLILISGSSTGNSPTSIPARLASGESADLLMMAGTELDKLTEQGLSISGTRKDLARSRIGLVVKQGSPKPDISTADKFKAALISAKSIGYSASVSGTYLEKEVFPALDSDGKIQAKAKKVVQERVASVVARGELELGLQQVSELISVPGVDFVGVIPEPYQKVTVFSVGIAKKTSDRLAAEELVKFLSSPEAAVIIKKQGLEPIGS